MIMAHGPRKPTFLDGESLSPDFEKPPYVHKLVLYDLGHPHISDLDLDFPQQLTSPNLTCAPARSKLVGVLFCQPHSKAGKDEILPGLDYFHIRTGRFLDIVCAGYQPYEAKHGVPVATVDGQSWGYSAAAFNDSRQKLQLDTKWKYSGETDLLLAVARKDPVGTIRMDYSCVISCKLEQMIRDGAISSIRSFFEQLSGFSEQYCGVNHTIALSDQYGLKETGALLADGVLKLVPAVLEKHYRSAKHFVISDVSL